MTNRSRLALWAVAFALMATACGGGGESDADRAAISEMLERLGRSPVVADCMVEELDGTYVAEDFQPLIDARGDYSKVDFLLLEAIVLAERACGEDDT